MRTLIVEDEALLAISTQADMESMGHEVVGIAESAEAALNLISMSQPELVLMDIVIKGDMNGIELTEEIAQRYPRCRVLYVTAHADADTVRKALKTRNIGILNKPLSLIKLQQMISSARADLN